MFDLTSPEIRLTLLALSQAAELVRGVQAELVSSALTKEDRSPVTIADFASQALVAHLLEQAFPDDPLLAEEDASALRQPEGREILQQVTRFVARFLPQAQPDLVCTWIDRGNAPFGGSPNPGQRFWTLDPIDGTKGFLRGGQYVVALALLVEGRVHMGALACPNLDIADLLPGRGDLAAPDRRTSSGVVVIAWRGQGTWCAPLQACPSPSPEDFVPLRVSDVSLPARARLLMSFESGHTNVDQTGEFTRLLDVQAEPVRMDSQAKYALLAAGKGDLLLRLLSTSQPGYREKIWDQAAGSLVVEEAGGSITDLDGRPLDFSAGRTLAYNRGLLASNGRLHPAALRALQAIGA